MVHFIEPIDLKTLLDTEKNIILCNFTNITTLHQLPRSLPKMKLPQLMFRNITKKSIDIKNIYPSIDFISLHERNKDSYIILYDDNTSALNFRAFDQLGYFYNYFLTKEKIKISILHGGLDHWIKQGYETITTLLDIPELDNPFQEDMSSSVLLPDDIADSYIMDFIKISGCCFQLDTLRKNNITYILNVSEFPTPSLTQIEFMCLDIPMKDNHTQDILQFLPTAFTFIDKALRTNSKILVHCQAGISRSVSIVMAWLIFNKKINVDKAFEIVKLHRPQASPNLNFWVQLTNFHKSITH
jgi:rhodanese-related sulfurtransferase